jgi:hypothetical protein
MAGRTATDGQVCVCVCVCEREREREREKTAFCCTVSFCKGFTRHKVYTQLSILLLSGVYQQMFAQMKAGNVPL